MKTNIDKKSWSVVGFFLFCKKYLRFSLNSGIRVLNLNLKLRV